MIDFAYWPGYNGRRQQCRCPFSFGGYNVAKTSAEVQRERRAAGLCCSCNAPAVRGGRCERHIQLAKVRDAERYREKQAAGTCGMCGKRQPSPGLKCCRICLDQQNEERRQPAAEKRVLYDKPWHARNREAGFCALGGAKHARPRAGLSLCDVCLAKKRARRNARVNAGKCVAHPDRDVIPGKRHCQECMRVKQKQRQERIAAGLCANNGTHARPSPGSKLCAHCLAEGRTKDKCKRVKARDRVISAYGGECRCCGNAIPQFLHLDHINNDGGAQRRKLFGRQSGASHPFYAWLRKAGFPQDDYQLLCANCNFTKAHYSVCPHQKLPPTLLQELRDFNRKIAAALSPDPSLNNSPQCVTILEASPYPSENLDDQTRAK